jgi:glutathione S-transferase
MTTNRQVTLFHSPNTRSTGALTLLEELGADYKLHVLNMKQGEQRAPEYLAINPMGKVPAVMHNGALITEQVAVYMYLADLYATKDSHHKSAIRHADRICVGWFSTARALNQQWWINRRSANPHRRR